MKRKYFITGLIIGLLLAFAVVVCLFRSGSWDKQHDSHTSEHAQVIADHDAVNAHGIDYRRIIDSLSINNYRLDSANKSLKQGQATTRKQLDLKTAEARDLAKEVQRRNKDTALQATIDSLIERVENYTFLLAQYESYTDSINHVNDSLKVNNDATIKEKDKRIAELQAAYQQLYIQYLHLDTINAVMEKDLKRQKLKTKVVAVLAGAAAVLGLVK